MTDGLRQITPPSAVVLDERKYPVITEDPSWSQIFSSYRTEDYKLLGAAVAIGAPWGYIIARLLGVLPNDEEVKAYGVERKGK
ncbi:hypothetical protein MNEG_8102 [Monoraphidium neglectum]|uniref:NADH-ubiquinone oxidoreductase 21kDa subunit N-terminal domain-containing protein n=1 Tax=Monoraphidium neglectum TaxID=145388 RepID=A0A0D2M983_9CHLO|nr:hypothetical protein MNEG_8102 [Monoraphidium neglectum]KIY99859.1 hypothetical protein MNEG_8102 [Monoraphidium neglectum]|eukprot:XP_013898879.1 hypothetical protein MNEG_8102 [Monoraphidium neglectum]